jgi:superfamily II DNA or RNA helicase
VDDPLINAEGYRGHPLRRWQREALDEWAQRDCRGVVEAITGTGKSLVGIAAIHKTVVVDGGKALVLVPTRSLLDQWVRLVRETLPGTRIGTLTAGSADTFRTSDVLIATVQTAWKSPPIPTSLGVLVADEVHRYGSEQYSKALHPNYQRRLGLTGTFERQLDDGVQRFLLPYFGSITSSYGYSLALREKVVAPFDLAFVAAEFTSHERRAYEEATTRCSESQKDLIDQFGYSTEWPRFFAEVTQRLKNDTYRDDESDLCAKYMGGFAERRRLTAEAAAKESFVAKLAPSFESFSGSLVFTETKESARRLGWIINRTTSAFPLTSDSSSVEREEKLRAFATGRLKVLCAPRILDEGVDVPEAEVAVIVATSKTARQMIQRMGRVIRLKKDGRSARIVILYIKGTGEDPDLGGHEGFLDAVRPFAASELMTSVEHPDAFVSWLNSRRSSIHDPAAEATPNDPVPKVTKREYNFFDDATDSASSLSGSDPNGTLQALNPGGRQSWNGSPMWGASSARPETEALSAYKIDRYRAFKGKLRRLSALSQAEVIGYLAKIVATEGPVLGYRIHDVFQEILADRWTTSQSGRTLNVALSHAVQSGELRATNPLQQSGVKPLTGANGVLATLTDTPAEPVDLGESSSKLLAANALRDETRDIHLHLTEAHKDFTELTETASKDAATSIALTDEYDLVRQLASAVAGRTPNTKLIKLETFVLAAELEDIVTAANQRLSVMTSGRYVLQHVDRAEYRNTRGGLGRV